MQRFAVLDHMVEEGNGYLCTSDVVEAGISRPTLAEYVKDRKMERVERGVYLSREAWPDALYQLSLVNKRIVFSYETALMLHGLTEREPRTISVTVPIGYNASHLRKRGIQVHQVKPDVAETGTVMVETGFGNPVRAYDRERTICDVLKAKDNMDVQIFQYAMKEYMAGKEKNLHRLMAYAEQFKLTDTVRIYTEVML